MMVCEFVIYIIVLLLQNELSSLEELSFVGKYILLKQLHALYIDIQL